MESSCSNLEESELQQMQLKEKELHQKCLAWFKKFKIHLGHLHKFSEIRNTRPFEITFRTTLDASLVTEGTTLEACLVDEGAVMEACLVTKGAALEACLVTKEQLDESSSSGNDADADIGPLYDCDTVSEACHDMFENVFIHGIQNHEQPESIPDTYVVNENISNIIFDILNMDPNRGQEEYDDVDNEQQRALFASLINNLKCDVKKCNKVNREA
nr:hypothetical protein [Tanacetum cinerariifolium]